MQLLNALAPILVTLFGIVIDVKSVQLLNAPSPILVNDTLVGKVIDAKLAQFQNA